jgi:GntR family transcriptional repressor for pyruvate dehydrogenase complex
LAFEVAAQTATESDIARLSQIVDALGESLAASDLERWAELNIEFHSTVANISNMKLLIEFSNRILDAWTRLRRWYLPPIIAQLPEAQCEHRKMIELLKQRDLEELTKVVTAHSQRLRGYAHQATAHLPAQSAAG